MSSYWQHTLERRISRRRTLVAGAGLAASTMFVLACGSGGENTGVTGSTGTTGSTGSTGAGDSPSLLTRPVDSADQAKRGGTFRYFSPVEMPNLDPIVAAASGYIRNRIYQKLVMPEAGYLQPALVGAVVPDAVEGWEAADGGTKIIFKLRANNHYDPRPPTSGRLVTTDDVLFTFERVEADSGRRADLFQNANADAPIISFSATDDRTFVLDLAYPDFGLLANLGTQNSGFPADILPREGETDAVNLRAEPRGSGPYFISRHDPSARIEFERNPGYYDDKQPYIDRIELPIITEYAARLAQFKAGNLLTMPVNAIDILPTKRALPELNLYEAEVVSANNNRFLWGWQEGSPFLDERVRQAFAYAIDRSLFIDALYNVGEFEKEGLAAETRYNSSSILASFDGFWLDPQSSEFGPNGKFFQHNLEEARALLSAAGYADGITADGVHEGGGRVDARPIEAIIGMVRDVGINLTLKPIESRSEFFSQYLFEGRGRFDGVAFGAGTSGADPGNQLYAIYHTRGSMFSGFDEAGTSAAGGDARVSDLVTKIRQEYDLETRWVLAHELQQYEAEKQYNPLFPGGARGFALAWPALANYGTWQVGQWDALERTWWIDETKAPLV